MNWSNPAIMLAFVAWGSVFVLSWLIVLDKVTLNPISSVAWVMFAVIALTASSVASSGEDE